MVGIPELSIQDNRVRIGEAGEADNFQLLYEKEVIAILDYYHDYMPREGGSEKESEHDRNRSRYGMSINRENSPSVKNIYTGDPVRDGESGVYVYAEGSFITKEGQIVICICRPCSQTYSWSYLLTRDEEHTQAFLSELWELQIQCTLQSQGDTDAHE